MHDAEQTARGEVTSIVFLVHGTFASSSMWDKALPLVRRLESAPGRIVATAEWTGGNTVQARHDGAKEAASQLTTLLSDHPRAKVVFVAHSHGGAVAIRAAQSVPPNRVAGIVCLATPFLHGTPRDVRFVEEHANVIAWTLAIPALIVSLMTAIQLVEWTLPVTEALSHTPFGILLMLAAFALGVLGLPALVIYLAEEFSARRASLRASLTDWLSKIGNTVPFWVAAARVAALLLVAALTVWVVGLWLSLTYRDGAPITGLEVLLLLVLALPAAFVGTMSLVCLVGADQKAEEICAQLSVAPPKHLPVLIIRRPADEAAGVFATAHFVGWITAWLWRVVTAIFKPGAWRRLFRPLVAFLVIFMLLNIIRQSLILGILLACAAAWMVATLIAVFRPTAAWMTWLCFFPIAASLSTFLAPFGFDLAFAGPLVEVTAESCPRGLVQVVQLEFSSMADGQMRHAVYRDPRCIDALSDWLDTLH